MSASPADHAPSHIVSGVDSRDGGGLIREPASFAAIRKARRCHHGCRQSASAVSSRSANRLLAAPADPKLPLPHSMAVRKARFAMLRGRCWASSRHGRPQIGRRRHRYFGHAAVVARRGPLSKPSAGRSIGERHDYEDRLSIEMIIARDHLER
jgi:hypothetical protein